MRIIPLLEELIQTQRSSKQFGGRFTAGQERRNDSSLLGKGKFSSVRPDRTDPHMVKKYNHTPLDPNSEGERTGDGFDLFIDYLIKNKLQDNIHFPRVYTSKRITDREGNHISKYQMETLVRGRDLSEEESWFVHDHLFDLGLDGADFGTNVDRADLMDSIGLALHACMSGRTCDFIKLKSIVSACKIIGEMVNTVEANLDMHTDNFMFRRTPHGLQLVITDPLSYVKGSKKYSKR